MTRFRPLQVSALPPAAYQSEIRVYYEDTDAGGIVYHANYLRFFERVRTDWLRSLGAVQREIGDRDGVFFVVRDITLDFRAPARLDDLLAVDVRVLATRRASLQLAQVTADARNHQVLVTAEVRVAAINGQGRPVGLPGWLLERIGGVSR